MKPYLVSQEQLDQLVALLKPTMEVVKPAVNSSIAFVVGATGDGKSTLLNNLAGCTYISEKNDLGNIIATLSPQSQQQESCKVGSNPHKSETRYPQLIKPNAEQNASSFLYCDLPGFFDSGSDAEAICSAAAPHIVTRAAKSIKGVVWALSLNQFEINKSEGIKKILGYLLSISKNNSELITESLVIVITRANNQTKKEQVLNRLQGAIESIEDIEQKKLLSKIVNRMLTDPSKLIISDVFDQTGLNREKINGAISALKEQDKNDLDFSSYTDQQDRFNQSIIEVAQLYQKYSEQLKGDIGKQSHMDAETAEISQRHNDLGTVLVNKNRKLQEIDQQLKAHKQQSDTLQKHIDVIEQTKIVKELCFKQEAELIPGYRERVCGPMDYNSPIAMTNRGNAIAQCYANGHSHIETNSCIYEVVPPKSKPGEATHKLHFVADYPVLVSERKFKKGESLVTGNESTSRGYEATIQYQIGKGADVTITLEIEKKNTPEGKKECLAERHLKADLDNKIQALEQEKEVLTSEITSNQSEQTQIKAKLAELEDTKNLMVTSIQKHQEILQTKNSFFLSVCTVAKNLGIKDESVLNLIKHFERQDKQHYVELPKTTNERYVFFPTDRPNDVPETIGQSNDNTLK